MKSIKISLDTNCPSNYNAGQRAEYAFVLAISGKPKFADNIKATESADFRNFQIKSSKSSVCPGSDIKMHIMHDKATNYAYVAKNGTVYIMDKIEYENFVESFHYVDHDSKKNGNSTKIRLKNETKKMLRWLENHL